MNFKRIFTLIFAFSFAWTINASAKTEIEWLQWFAAALWARGATSALDP